MGASTRKKPTAKHNTRDIPYDFFVKSRLPVILQTRQTIGRYGVGKPLAGLAVMLEFETYDPISGGFAD